MSKENHYDIERMAEICVCLIKNFGTDSLIKFLLDRLIRQESDLISPLYKSTKVIELEEKFNVSLCGVSRRQLKGGKYKVLSKFVDLEHGLPESQAIKMFFKEPEKEKIKNILIETKRNLVYITKEEHKKIGKGLRTKKKNGFYWDDIYKKNDISIVGNE